MGLVDDPQTVISTGVAKPRSGEIPGHASRRFLHSGSFGTYSRMSGQVVALQALGHNLVNIG
jgi:hypothetical protein